jgi:D-glycero-alpha-D-manno-heptose-7-phosphate kinase
VEKIDIAPEIVRRLERNLLLFFTGSSRNASMILKKQAESSRRQDPAVIDALHQVKTMAYQVRQTLSRGDLDAFGQLLHQNWEQKKRFAGGVSNLGIDEMYQTALDAGAMGGKITGAGGGGFLMLYCRPESQPAVTRTLEDKGLKRMDYRFESMGARVLVNAGLSLSLVPH